MCGLPFSLIYLHVILQGVGVSTFDPKQNLYPLVNGVDIALNAESRENARYTHVHIWHPKKMNSNKRILYA